MEAIGRQQEADRLADQRPLTASGVSEALPPTVAWTIQGDRVALRIDLSIYTLEATLRAAYRFTDRAYVFAMRALEVAEELTLVLTAKRTEADMSAIVGEFTNELLDQRLRGSLDAEFGTVRTLIVAQAFSEGNLLNESDNDGGS